MTSNNNKVVASNNFNNAIQLDRLTKHPRKDRVHMFGVVAEVEFFANLVFAERFHHVFIVKQFFEENFAFFSYAHGVALNQAV